MGVDIHVVRTRREKTGLAMSTRNNYLSKEERENIAPLIWKSLGEVEEVGRREGVLSVGRAREVVEKVFFFFVFFSFLFFFFFFPYPFPLQLLSPSPLQLEYVNLTDWETGTPLTDPNLSFPLSPPSSSSSSPLLVGDKKILVAVAAKLGNTRLLDNVLL